MWPLHSRWRTTTGLCSAMADEGLQAVLGLEGKGSLHPKMEKTLYSRWFRIEGVPKRVFFADFMDFSAGSTIKEGQKSRILLNGERRRIIPVSFSMDRFGGGRSGERAYEQMVLGVATRSYGRSLEAVPEGLEARGESKGAVSRRFVAATSLSMWYWWRWASTPMAVSGRWSDGERRRLPRLAGKSRFL